MRKNSDTEADSSFFRYTFLKLLAELLSAVFYGKEKKFSSIPKLRELVLKTIPTFLGICGFVVLFVMCVQNGGCCAES